MDLAQAMDLVRSGNPNARQRGALELGTLADASVAEEMVELLIRETNPFVAETLTWAIVAHPQWTTAYLVQRLGEVGPERPKLLHALSKIRDEATLPAIVALVDDLDWRVKAKAWWAVGRIGREQDAAILTDRLGQSDPELRLALTRAIEQMGQPALPGISAALTSGDEALQRHALEALSTIAGDRVEALDGLVAAAHSQDREVVVRALEAMAPIPDPRVDDILTALRDGEDQWLATVADWFLTERAAS